MKHKFQPISLVTRGNHCLLVLSVMVLFCPAIRAEEEFSDTTRLFGVNSHNTPIDTNVLINKAEENRQADTGKDEEEREKLFGEAENPEEEKSSLTEGQVYISQNQFAQEQSVSGVREPTRLREIQVIERKPVTAASSEEVRRKDFELLPILTDPSELLRVVPGLVILQHQGGGKADQYLLRGFNADHGTDVALFIDKLPVNLRSHAHGQGYADLHFVIPETIQLIEVYEGPYFPEFGDFDNAGAVRLDTRDFVPESFVQASAGLYAVDRFRPIARILTLFSPTRGDVKTLGAFEFLLDDGPFINENDLIRFNGFGKLTWDLTENSQLKIWGSGYYGTWDASGQIPLRAVKSGLIDRFGAIDPSEGGRTQRYNAYVEYSLFPDDKSQIVSSNYFTYSKLDLFSNFTFLLNDPINGDGIVQRENRYLYGTDTRYNRAFTLFGREGLGILGIQVRGDNAHVVLANQTKRIQTSVINDVDFFEISLSPWAELDLNLADWARTVLGVRWDIFRFDVNNKDNPEIPIQGEETDSIVSYKANLILSPIKNTEFYLNFGTGFHSNDARVVISDPSTTTLPRSIGFEIGSRTRLFNRLDLAAAFWYLYLQDELVFVGDEGIFEPSGSTRRFGGDFEARLSLFSDWLFLHSDFNIIDAKFTNGDEIPLAPTIVSRSGAALRTPFGLSGAIEFLFLADRPADETGLVDAEGFTRVDLTLNYRYRNLEAFLIIENLFNSNYRDAQNFFESQLPGEPFPVADIHFTPGPPFAFRVGLTYYLTGLIDKTSL